jgi:hypothetical protein
MNAGEYAISGLPASAEKSATSPLHGIANYLIADYLKEAGHGADSSGAPFRPFRNSREGGHSRKQSRPTAFISLVPKYTALLGLEIRVHTLRGTAATKHSVMRRIAGLVVSMKRVTDRTAPLR